MLENSRATSSLRPGSHDRGISTQRPGTLSIPGMTGSATGDALEGKSSRTLYENPTRCARCSAIPRIPAQLPDPSGTDDVEITVSAVYDSKQNYLGPIATWLVITE